VDAVDAVDAVGAVDASSHSTLLVSIASTIAGPWPRRATKRPTHSAPSRPPTASPLKTSPHSHAAMCSRPASSTISIEPPMTPHMLDSAEPRVMARSSGWPRTKRSPSAISERRVGV